MNYLTESDLLRIVRKVLNEQSTNPTNTGTTQSKGVTQNNQTGQTQNQQINAPNTGTTSAQTTTNTGTTTNEPVLNFGNDRNAVAIEDRAEDKKVNEGFENSLLNEINKMKFLFNYDRGVILSEQKKNLFESDGSDDEKPPFNKPIVTVKKLNNTEWRVLAFGTFPANITSGPLAKAFMDTIVNELYKDPTLSDPQYKGRITMTVAHIFGGASNYLQGPVKPDMDVKYEADKGLFTYTAIPSATTEANKSKYTGKYDSNTNLAKGRAQNLFNILKSELPLRAGNKIKVTAKPEIKGYNVNTGDKIDKDRDSSKFPVPGQHVNMSLIIKVKPKTPSKVGSLECMKGLTVRVASTRHSCDTAAFDVKLSGVPLGEVDLGNYYVGTSEKDENNRTRYQLAGSKSDGNKGGSRWRDFKIDASKASSFVTSTDGSVTVSIKGKDSEHYETRFGLTAKQSYRGTQTSHSDVPYVTIKKSDGTTIYDQAPTPNTYAFGGARVPCGNTGNPCKEYVLLKFNPCATNFIDGDLTGF